MSEKTARRSDFLFMIFAVFYSLHAAKHNFAYRRIDLAAMQIDPGKLISVHPTSPILVQRASIVAALSFVFFLAMLLTFYLRQQIGYFMLGSAFLIVHLATLAGIWLQKRNTVKLYENGLYCRQSFVAWKDISLARESEAAGLEIISTTGKKLIIPRSLFAFAVIADKVRSIAPTGN